MTYELKYNNFVLQHRPAKMNIFKSNQQQANLLRAYTLRYCYEQAKTLDKSKSSTDILANCIIIRKHKVRNQTEFGYKEELKTNTLKKIYFVYLESVEDLVGFLWQHLQTKEQLFGMLFIENVEAYFGEYFEYRQCGKSFLIFIKLLKMLAAKIRIKGRVCFSYVFNEQIFKHRAFEQITREEDFTNWELREGYLTKNGERYESDSTRIFFENYMQISN